MADTIIGFAPNWNTAGPHNTGIGVGNAGLSIYISPGKINGKVYQGGVYAINAALNAKGLLNASFIQYFWMDSSGNIQQTSAAPGPGVFPIAAVTVSNVYTGSGNGILQLPLTQMSNFAPLPPPFVATFQFFSQQTQSVGVTKIDDLRPSGEFSFA